MFGNQSNNIAIRIGNATSSGFSTSVEGLSVQWGKWTSSSSSPSYWQDFNGTEEGTISTFILASAPTTASATIAKVRGSMTFNATSAFLADKKTGSTSINSVTGSFDVDLSAGSVSNGTLNVCIGTNGCTSVSSAWEKWETTFTGTLTDRSFSSSLSGSISESTGEVAGLSGGQVFAVGGSRAVSGNINGSLTGTSAEGFVLGFKMIETSVSTNTLIGASVFKVPQAISQSEINLLTYNGIAIVGPNDTASNLGISLGKAPDLYVAREQWGDVLVYSQNPGFVLRRNNLSEEGETLSTSILGFDASWARWGGSSAEPLKYQYHLSNGAIYNDIGGKVIFASAAPAQTSLLTGQKYFETSYTSANRTAGTQAASSVKGKFNINLDTGALTNGKFEVTTGAETWTTSLFTGQVSNGTLGLTNVTGQVKNTENTDSFAFSGKVAGHFTGTSTLGFLAGFDFTKDGASQHIFGTTLLSETTLTSVMTTEAYNAFGHATLYGFALAQDLGGPQSGKRLSIYGNVTVNDGDAVNSNRWGTEKLISADLSNLFVVDSTPDYILERYEANFDALNAQENGTTWGKWTANAARVYTDYLDDRAHQAPSQPVLFANFTLSTQAELSTLSQNNVKRSYSGTSTSEFGVVQNYISNAYLPIQEFKSVFDVDFNSGAITKGRISLCLNSTCNTSGAEAWEIRYQGTLNRGLLVNPQITLSTVNENTVSLTGTVLGAFTHSDAGLYVGGFNFALASNPGHYVSAIYDLELTTFLTAAEIEGLEDHEYGMLATSGTLYGIYGGRSQQKGGSNNYLLANYLLNPNGWNTSASFHKEVPDSIFRRGTATENVTINVANLGNKLLWGKWAGTSGAPIRQVTFGSTDGNLEQDAYWFIAKPEGPTQQSGKYAAYSNVLAAQGGGSAGAVATSDVKFGFVLDLGSGAISNGQLKITTPGSYSWNVAFTGQSWGKTTSFGPYAVYNITSATLSSSPSNYTFGGNLTGMFIDDGKEVVTSFSLNNTDTAGSGEHVSGTVVAGKENLNVDWGSWNQPVLNNWSGQLLTDAQTLFTSLQLTPDYVINSMTGSFYYTGSTGSGQGFGSAAGSFSSVNAQMTVDFTNAQINDGHVTLTTATSQEWHAHFTGSFDGNNVTLSPQANSFTIDSVNNAGNVRFGGTFTGATGSQFQGAFEMLDAANSANYVQGLFTLDKGSSAESQ